jgi:aldehyde dehydrogenase (NAD+)/betaine-aldehyde dehydrogenase
VERSRRALDDIVVGDPWDERTHTGPVISEQHRDRIASYVAGALADGGVILAQSPLPRFDRGWWVAPTLIGDMDPMARICQEEIFGPVSVVLPYDSVDEAVAVANAVRYGLAGYVYGPDLEECHRVASRLRVGAVYVNGGGDRRADAPSGGFKMSGIGRELGQEGIGEFLEVQHIQWALEG